MSFNYSAYFEYARTFVRIHTYIHTYIQSGLLFHAFYSFFSFVLYICLQCSSIHLRFVLTIFLHLYPRFSFVYGEKARIFLFFIRGCWMRVFRFPFPSDPWMNFVGRWESSKKFFSLIFFSPLPLTFYLFIHPLHFIIFFLPFTLYHFLLPVLLFRHPNPFKPFRLFVSFVRLFVRLFVCLISIQVFPVSCKLLYLCFVLVSHQYCVYTSIHSPTHPFRYPNHSYSIHPTPPPPHTRPSIHLSI